MTLAKSVMVKPGTLSCRCGWTLIDGAKYTAFALGVFGETRVSVVGRSDLSAVYTYLQASCCCRV